MIKLTWYENNSTLKGGREEKKWYVHPTQEETLSIREMAACMALHHTPFSAGTIEGLLRDFVDCINEQLLEGKTVKIDNLAIFKLAVESNGFDTLGAVDPATAQLGVQARIGEPREGERMNPAVRSLKLLSQATGTLARKQLNQRASLGWSTLAQAQMEAERRKAEEALGRNDAREAMRAPDDSDSRPR